MALVMMTHSNDLGTRETMEHRCPTAEVDLQLERALSILFPHKDLTPCAVADWIHLNEGERIVAQREWEYPKAGEIDAVSDDAFVFWVWLDNGEGRVMINAQDNVRIWRFS